MLRPFFEEERDFFRNWYSNHLWELNAPNVFIDMYQEGDFIKVDAHMPGIKSEDVSVEIIAGNRLKISGNFRSCEKKDKAHFYKREIKSGAFEKILLLPHEVEANQVCATIDNGLLHIKLPIKREKIENSVKVKVQEK